MAYSNVKAVEYLLNHGASQWLLTEEDTSLTLGERELAAQREIGDEANVKAALYCLTLLHGMAYVCMYLTLLHVYSGTSQNTLVQHWV